MSNNRNPSQNPTEKADTTAVVAAVTTKDFAQVATRFEEQFSRLIPSAIKRSDLLTGKRVVGLLVNAFSTNPELRECKPSSILNAAGLACAVGLEFNNALGQSALIPYKKQGVRECQWQMMYRGGITLAMRSGKVQNCYASVVLEQDEFDYEYGTNEYLRHKPASRLDDFDFDRDWTKTYFYARYGGGAYTFHVMDRADVELIKKQSSTAVTSSPWNVPAFKQEMIRKTPTKQHLKYMDLTPHLSMAVGLDDQADAGVGQDQVIEWKDYTSEDVDHPHRKAQAQGVGSGTTRQQQRPPQQTDPQTEEQDDDGRGQGGADPNSSGDTGDLFGGAAETAKKMGPFTEEDFSAEEFGDLLTHFKAAGFGNTKAQLLALLGKTKLSRQDLFQQLGANK